MGSTGKVRLDKLLVDRGIVASREKARALIMAGDVLVEDAPASKAGTGVDPAARVRLRKPPHPYVGRGGMKLRGALDAFGIIPAGYVAADIGSSTGGFTDCLLQSGALKVYAVDVDTGQLDWKLRRDSRVVPVQGNARYLEASWIPEAPDLVTMDVSFISATLILPALTALVALAGRPTPMVILVKPQFELRRAEVGKGGIVTAPGLHRKAIDKVARSARDCGLEVVGEAPSPITGKEGNREFFLHLEWR
jgi:23S rRNA (cytidine1920-2'-O)/16S rRNA (cytidine1409-2'-O)-methyltransferase